MIQSLVTEAGINFDFQNKHKNLYKERMLRAIVRERCGERSKGQRGEVASLEDVEEKPSAMEFGNPLQVERLRKWILPWKIQERTEL